MVSRCLYSSLELASRTKNVKKGRTIFRILSDTMLQLETLWMWVLGCGVFLNTLHKRLVNCVSVGNHLIGRGVFLNIFHGSNNWKLTDEQHYPNKKNDWWDEYNSLPPLDFVPYQRLITRGWRSPRTLYGFYSEQNSIAFILILFRFVMWSSNDLTPHSVTRMNILRIAG